MKTMDEKIHRDAEALADDIRRVRNDLIGLLSSSRRRAKKAAADLADSSPGTAVYVEEPGQQEKVVVVKRSRAWARILAVIFALGTAVAVLRMRRSTVIVTHRRRPRFRRVATRTVIPEPAAEETPFPGRSEAMSREESRTEGLPLR